MYGHTGNHRYIKKNPKELRDSYVAQIKDQIRWYEMIHWPVFVYAELYWKWAELDRDNFHKISMDVCSGLIREDDSQIKVGVVWKIKKDNTNPRIVLQIYEIKTENVLKMQECLASAIYHNLPELWK